MAKRVKAQIIVEFEVTDEKLFIAEQHLANLLRDALAEFRTEREANLPGGAGAYVARRYPTDTVYKGKRRERKVREVHERCAVALQIKDSAKIEFLPLDPKYRQRKVFDWGDMPPSLYERFQDDYADGAANGSYIVWKIGDRDPEIDAWLLEGGASDDEYVLVSYGW